MKIKSLNINNFRLLEDIPNFELNLNHTIIVWRNNSWKTSLTELFKKFCGESNKFQFDDFSLNSHTNFIESVKRYKEYKIIDDWNTEEKENKEKDFKESIPKIELNIKFILENWDDKIGFTDDLDDNYKEYNLLLELSLNQSINFFENIPIYILVDNKKFIKYLKEKFEWNFSIKINKQDSTWKITKCNHALNNIFNVNFIDAQRHLDDNSNDKNKTLSKIFELNYNSNNEIDKKDSLKNTIDKTNNDLDKEYITFFEILQKDLKEFWYPWLWNNDKELKLKSELNIDKLIKGDNAKIYYNQWTSDLPESYNGLWYSNLIYIILQLIHFNWEFEKINPRPQFQLLFIEEPEAHLHPQMQQTFIKQIQKFIDKKNWNIQIVITTHSSHIISSSEFDKIRYFIKKDNWTDIKNLWLFIDDENKQFIKKYLTLEKADMFFSDKLIMIEWMVERILLPSFVKKIDEGLLKNNSSIDSEKLLSTQYISTIEVWGAYAHKFKKFLEFLEIKTLIITDIDSVDKKTIDEKKALWLSWDKTKFDDWKYKKYKVCEAKKTSNPILKSWIPEKEKLSELNILSEEEKEINNFRVAYQIEENWNIWRSFEDAFILANSDNLSNFSKEWFEILKYKFNTLAKKDIEKKWYYEVAEYIDKNKKKTDFAFDIMMLDDFNVPKYIKEGLIWLSK